MPTVMQRWNSVKIALQQETQRLDEAVDEAVEIIKENCGQKVTVITTEFFEATYCNYKERKWELQGRLPGWQFYLRDIAPNKHCQLTLKQAETIAKELAAIHTGTLIAAWEQAQLNADTIQKE